MGEAVVVTIAKGGSTEIKVEGVKGKRCTELTKNLVEALGTVVEEQKTDEYYQTPDVKQGQQERATLRH